MAVCVLVCCERGVSVFSCIVGRTHGRTVHVRTSAVTEVLVLVFGHRSVRTLTFDHLTPVLRLRQIGPTRTQVTHHTNLSHDYSAVVRLTSSCGHSIVLANSGILGMWRSS